MRKLFSFFLTSLLALTAINLSFAQTSSGSEGVLARSCIALNYNMSYKSRDVATNNEVSKLQSFLIAKGYATGKPTGYFGLSTQKAVMAFQKKNKLIATGIVGKVSRTKIKDVSCASKISATTVKSATSTSPKAIACTMEMKFCPSGDPMQRDVDCNWRGDLCKATSTTQLSLPVNSSYTNQNNPITYNSVNNSTKIDTGPVQEVPHINPAIILDGSGSQLNMINGCQPKDINDFLTQIVGAKKRVQPEDCRMVNTSEAIFHWGNPDDKKAGTMWTLKIFDESGSTVFSKEVKSPRAIVYSDEFALSKGVKYSWSTSYVNKSGAVRQSGQRRFMISTSASNFSLPKGAYVADVASEKPFPRRLPAGKTFDEIKTLSSAGDEKEIYNGMINLANYYKGKASPENPDTTPTYPTGPEIQSRLWYYKDAIDYLAYAYYFTKDESYLVSGKAKLLELAGIDPNGVSGELNDAKFKTSIGRSGDQLNRTAYLALASGFDLYYPYLSQEEKTAVISAYKTRILQAWPITTSLDVYSYDSHGLTVLGMLTQSLLHVVGAPEFEEGKAMLTEIFDIYKLEINMFGYEDGGFGNGVEYAWHNFYNLIPIVEDLYLITNINLANNQYLKNYGSYLMNFTLHTSDNNNFPFGDGGVIKNFYNDVHVYDYFRSYALLTGVSEYEWYWRQGDKTTQKLRNTRPSHLFMLGTGLVRSAGVAPSKGSTLFEDAGMFAAHSNIADKNRSTLYFKSSPFGSFNHSLAESNTFNFDSKGRSLLINSGYYSSYGDEHHNKVRRATKYKNSLTVNGGYGQAERVSLASYSGISNPIDSKDTTGKMINYLDNGDVVAITGDATLAYRYIASNGTLQPTLNSAIRSVVYIRSKGVVIVYDYADSSEEKKWELNFHSFEPFENNQGVIKVSNQGVNACMELYGLDYKYSSSDKFDIPQAQGLKDQYHARLEAVTPSKTLSSITVIKEGCNNVGVVVSATGTALSIKLDSNQPIVFDRSVIRIPAP